ncbi:SEC10/PgrA surface exclusion domain-containing protein [Limosilactobacillus reuteri]|uniref:SEC10/PgrA surface exclusion domain-containing protein n=1 Tax=Limosilactobacillus reuteri TaxID=1598 RepID=UPI001E3AA2AE|nr:SEC10/PgrA surface exclusion domain-containing protein [Limosilactobacillus reuteri]MCC4485918.1 SEC10/PgrA surface exclusion domain-containing protein [Limosilactobacillus reuteri]
MEKTMKNKALVATTAVAGITLVGGVTTAHAAENVQQPVNEQNVDQSSQEEKQAAQNLQNAQSDVNTATEANSNAQDNLASANNNLNNAKKAVSDQAAKVADATLAQSDASAKVDNDNKVVADAQQKADQATPANIENANQAIENQNKVIDQDNENIKHSNTDQDKAQNTLNNAQANEDKANATLSNKKSSQASAQNNVKQAEDALNGTHLVEAQNTFNQAQSNVENAQSKYDQANNQLSDAQKKVTTNQNDLAAKNKALDNINTQVATDQNNVNSNQATADSASSATQVAQNAVDQTKQSLDKVIEELNGFAENTIKVPAGAQEAYEAFTDAVDNNADQSQLDSLAKKMYDTLHQGQGTNGINHFNSSKYDQNQLVDVDHLTTDQLNELTQFAADMINSARKAWGSDKNAGILIPTQGVSEMAQQIAKGYVSDNWHISQGHDVKRVTEAAGLIGLNDAGQFYEDASEGYVHAWPWEKDSYTMDNLKEAVYDSILGMLFADDNSGNGHMTDLLGLHVNRKEDHQYFGLSTNMCPGSYMGQLHFIIIENDPAYIKDPQTFNAKGGTTKIEYIDPKVQLNQQKDILTTTLSTQQVDLATKQDALNKANQNLANAKKQLSKDQDLQTVAQQNRDSAQKALNDATATVSNLQATVDGLNQDLNSAKATLDQAKKTLDSYTADHKAKLDNYNNAKAALDDANKAVAEAQSAVDTAVNETKAAQNNLNQKKQAVTDAQNKLANDQEYLATLKQNLADLQNAPQNLQNAKEQLAKDQIALDNANKDLQNQKDSLDDLNKKLDDAQVKVDEAQSAVNVTKATLDQAQAKLSDAEATWKELHNDAHRYGNVVKVTPITMEAGASLPDPVIENGFTVNTGTNQLFVSLAAIDSSNNNIPQGTKASWANRSKALTDSQNAGSYSENILITFPDNSTVTVPVDLTVTPKKITEGQKATEGGYHIVNGSVVDNQNNLVSGWTVKNGQMVDPEGNVIKTTMSTAQDVTIEKNNSKSGNTKTNMIQTSLTIANNKVTTNKDNQLPQTGNYNKNTKALGLAGIALASALTMFGYKKRQHN